MSCPDVDAGDRSAGADAFSVARHRRAVKPGDDRELLLSCLLANPQVSAQIDRR